MLIRCIVRESIRLTLDDLSSGSRFNTEWTFLKDLKARGRGAAEEWLEDCFGDVGVRSSVDLQARFG